MVSPFRYEVPKTDLNKSCTFKIRVGKKYMIWKALRLEQSLESAAIQIDRGIRIGLRKESAFVKLVDYIKKARITFFSVEIMLTSDKPVALLRSEYLLLRKASKDPDCLNMVFVPYFPKWISNKDAKEFEKWKATLNKKKNGTAKNNKVLSTRKVARPGKKETTKRKIQSNAKGKKLSRTISKK